MFYVFLLGLDFEVFVFDVEAETVIDAHVLVGDPDDGEKSDEISTPPGVQHLKAGDDQEDGSNVVAEAVFAGKEIEKLSAGEAVALSRLPLAVFARLAKNFFMSSSPGNAGHGNREHQQPGKLHSERHGKRRHKGESWMQKDVET